MSGELPRAPGSEPGPEPAPSTADNSSPPDPPDAPATPPPPPQDAAEPTPALPVVTCPGCARVVPAGEYCGACGARLGHPHPAGARSHAYAASPGEAVFHLSVVSSLFPHLSRHRMPVFRAALIGLGLLLAVLDLTRINGAAVAIAAAGVPVLYLLYLRDVEVYEDQPVLVVLLTFGLGAVLGGLAAYFGGPLISQAQFAQMAGQAGIDSYLLVAAGVPLASFGLMLLGPLFLYFTNRFEEALDGFAFGAASALGFTFASTLVNVWPELEAGLISSEPVGAGIQITLVRGLLLPFINASGVGLVAGALWLASGGRRYRHRSTSILNTVAGVAALRILLGLVDLLSPGTWIEAAVYLVGGIGLLLWVRLAIHHMLLAEAVEVAIGPSRPCSHCHRLVPRMAFCPNCGVATRATPKLGESREQRKVR